MTDTTFAPADAPAIPGLAFRGFRDDSDWTALAALIRAAHQADGVDWLPNAESIRIEFENTDVTRIDRDVLFAEVDGRLVAEADAETAIRDGHPVHRLSGVVHPNWRRRGLGRALLRWNEDRARRVAKADATFGGPDARLGSWVPDGDLGGGILLRQEGYQPERYGFTMVRRGLVDVEELSLPDGLEFRAVHPDDHRAIFDADEEAFRDHPGHRASTDADFVAHFAEPEIDTSLWRVAWDGDQVVGSVMTYVWRGENETLGVRRGWLEHISVRRPWRGRGVARALIASSLAGMRDAGMEEAMLGVDAENPSGALHLYESMGFAMKDRSTSYRKPLEGPGRLPAADDLDQSPGDDDSRRDHDDEDRKLR
jgi:mycothiol synthase